MKKCDVIIPIYNAYDAVKDCIYSVIKNTDLKENSLILINDCSTDKNISKFLNDTKKEHSNLNIIVLENKTNLGFVKTVNIGMKYSKNDVLLLNSDTEVPKNWLDKIKKCAYSQVKVATVTPLSNNATLVSVPNGLQRNEMPKGMDIDSYDKLIEKIAYCDYPELPTAHGFCMYIKRDVLNIVGFFDEEVFDKGYGEENDFCYRCLDYGYKHLLCDNTIVYHKESQSFSSRREELVKEHTKIIENRYPSYKLGTDLWLQEFPIDYICTNVKYHLNLRDRKNILILIHEWDGSENQFGGTTLHVKDIISNLRSKYNFHVLIKEKEIYRIYSYFENYENKIDIKPINNFSMLPSYNEEYKKMVSEVIDAFNISYVHVHHMINHFFDIGDVIKEKNITGIVSIHDLFSLCPISTMLYKAEKNCLDMKNKDCGECLKEIKGIQNNIIDEWRRDWKTLFENTNEVIVPSEFVNKTLSVIYPKTNIKVIEHGIGLKKVAKEEYKIKFNMNIAFLGNIVPHKGLAVLKELKKEFTNTNINIHIFGDIDEEKLKKSGRNYYFHGAYKREELSKLFIENNIDLVCLFSLCVETYSYTLTESIACGVPVIGYNIGAVNDRIIKDNLGWTIDINSSIEEKKIKIVDILRNENEYNKKLASINKYHIKTIEEMVKEYDSIYDKNKIIIDNNKLNNFIKTYTKKEIIFDNTALNIIVNSLKWKIVSKIKVPTNLKKFIKKIVKK